MIQSEGCEKLYPRLVEPAPPSIDPEPPALVREAIVAALREEPESRDGWAAAALGEGVDAEGDD